MGLSQRDAAAVLGVNQKTVSNDLREENSSPESAQPQVSATDAEENSSLADRTGRPRKRPGSVENTQADVPSMQVSADKPVESTQADEPLTGVIVPRETPTSCACLRLSART